MANQIVTGLKSGIRISGRFQPESEFQISPEVFKLTKKPASLCYLYGRCGSGRTERKENVQQKLLQNVIQNRRLFWKDIFPNIACRSSKVFPIVHLFSIFTFRIDRFSWTTLTHRMIQIVPKA